MTFSGLSAWRRISTSRIAATAVLCFLAAVGAAPPASAATGAPISGAGSTWAENAVSDWTANLAGSGTVVNYAGTGSSDGRAQFRNGTVDFAASDLPYGLTDNGVTDPVPTRPFSYLPVVAGAVSLPYNLSVGGQRVTNLRLSGLTVAKIFTQAITQWNDPAVQADNPGLALPAIPVVPVVRSDGVGTTQQLTQWLATQFPALWDAYCASAGRTTPCGSTSFFPTVPGDVSMALSVGVTSYVAQSQNAGAITYVESSYALNAALPMAKLLNAAGYYAAPTAGAVAVALTAAQVDPSLIVGLGNVYTNTDPRAYPLSAVSYLIVPTTTAAPFSSIKGVTLGAFAQYALCQGQQDAPRLGYSPLAPNLVQAGLAVIPRIPGAGTPTINPATCANPSNALIANTPQPQPCDHLGSPVCASSAPPIGALAVSPGGSATQGAPITLTATFSPILPGTVQFYAWSSGAPAGSTPLSTAPAAGGSATITVSTLPVGSYTFSATFTPSSPAGGPIVTTLPVPYTVTPSTLPPPGTQVITTTLPPGSLVIVVAGNSQITLPSPVLDPSGALLRTSGDISPLTVTDSRAGNPGWTVSGQAGDFTDGAGDTVVGQNLGWTPIVLDAAAAQVVTAGPPVIPAAETAGGDVGGLGTARTLAAGTGLGTAHLGATLHLDVPTSTPAGTYIATLTLTAI